MPHHHHPHKHNWEPIIVAIILAVGVIFRGDYILTLAGVIAMLTILGVYFFVKHLFNWEIGAFSAFFLAISHWHVILGRAQEADMLSLALLVWGMYFFWRGLRTAHWWHFAASGILWGFAMYGSWGFRLLPIAALFAVSTHWRAIEQHFAHDKFNATKHALLRGLATCMVVAIVVVLPLVNSLSNAGNAILPDSLTLNIPGIFNDSYALIYWPVLLFFIIGFFRALHKHKTTHVFVFTWVIVGLLPALLVQEANFLYAAAAIIPAICILAAEGLWWFYDFMRKEEHHHIAMLVILLFLFSVLINAFRLSY